MNRSLALNAAAFIATLFATSAVWSLDQPSSTHRIPQFENSHVKVWKSTIAPNAPLPLHRHVEFAAEKHGYSATKHRHKVGTGYFDDVAQVIAAGLSSTTGLRGTTEHEQLH